jgi:hypothetical protein
MNTGPPIRCPHHHGTLSRWQFFGTTASVALGTALFDVTSRTPKVAIPTLMPNRTRFRAAYHPSAC